MVTTQPAETPGTASLGDRADVPEPRPARRAGSWRTRISAVASVLGGTALITAHGQHYGFWIIDDAAISFSYARSFAEGLGPVVQDGGQPVEGFSNVTWTLLLALGKLAGLFDRGTILGMPDYAFFPKALALVLCAGILTACHAALSKVQRRPWLGTLAVGALLASTPSFVIWIVSGLENALYGLLITTLAVLVFRAALDGRVLRSRLAIATGLLAALAALTRPEGLIYGGVYPIVVLGMLWSSAGQSRDYSAEQPTGRFTFTASIRHILISVTAFLVPVTAYFTWRRVTFGEWLSAPSIAKSQSLPAPEDFTKIGQIVDYAGAPAIVLVVLMAGLVLARAPWWRPGLLALLVPLGLALTAFTVLEEDWMGELRFATPIWILGALVTVLVTTEAFRRMRVRGRVVAIVALVVALVGTGATFVNAANDFRANPTLSACHVADRYGRAFNGYADTLGLQQASLFMPDLGGSSMTSRLEIVDMAGLTNIEMAHLISDREYDEIRDYVFEETRPTFIHTRLPWHSLRDDERLQRDYHQIYALPGDDAWPDGDWVRKDAVPNREALQRVRDYADEVTVPLMNYLHDPLRACGDTMHVGSTPPRSD